MKKSERNAILAGLRFLQGNYFAMPREIRVLMKDGIEHKDALTVPQIDTLCEAINFAEVDFERPDTGEFEVERVHLPINEPTAENCSEDTCSNRHYWAVYCRDPKTRLAEWISDHSTDAYARTAAAAYAKR